MKTSMQALRADAPSALETAAHKAAEKFYGATAAVDPGTILVWGQLIATLIGMFQDCRARRAEGSEAEQLIQAAKNRRFTHVVRARQAARDHFGRFRRREIVRAADAVLDAAAESNPEAIEALFDDLESR